MVGSQNILIFKSSLIYRKSGYPVQFMVQVNKKKKSKCISLENSRMESEWQGDHGQDPFSPLHTASAEEKLEKHKMPLWSRGCSKDDDDSPELLSVSPYTNYSPNEAQAGIKIAGRNINICRWHHLYDRKWRGTKEPLDESERGE